MSSETPVREPLHGLLPTNVEGFDSLAELALDMHSTWNHATDHVWRWLDPVLWGLTQNPWGSYRPSRGRSSRASWPIPRSARASTTW